MRQVSNNIAVIDSIDSIFNGNEYRKTWYYSSKNSYWNGKIIEDIGCDHGLLEGLIAMLENNGDLVCYSENGQTIYPVYSPSSCDLVSSIHDKIPATQNTIIIAPNPSSEFIKIQSLNGIDVDKYLIYDITGKIITYGSLSPDKIISIRNLNIGLYFLKLLDRQSNFVCTLKIGKN